MSAGSSGTVTFLFTDIEGSTRQWEQEPDRMRSALALHDALMRDVVEAHDGRVVKSTGDGVFASFSSPQHGALSAVAAQIALAEAQWPDGLALRVRMGLHSGSATERDGDYLGPDVNRVARVMSVAHGGQIVCSAAVAEFVRDSCSLEDLGEHRLRDLQSAVHLFQVNSPGLPSAFPPLRSLDTYRSNLPYELSSFVGREEELRALAEHMRSSRVVSIVGVGGVGKTRLALQVGSELLPHYPDGVWLCELAQVLEPEELPDAVAAAVGYVPPQGVAVADDLPRYLERKELLLILDNCEHLVDTIAEFVTATTTRAPRVSLLVTSREALGVRGEHVSPLASLGLPAADDAASVLASDAGALFVERAGEARGELAVDAANSQAVHDLCARLDGIPLAIELAAAQTKMMTPAEILTRLDKQFRLLTGGRRTRLERHQTLRAAIDWSYDLLNDDERAVLDRLAVCVGGFDLDAAAAISAGIGVDEFEAFELLASLVAKSLVERNERNGVTRYRLLEMIRQYAAERLNATDAAEAARDDHSRYYLALAISLFGAVSTPDGFEALDHIDTEIVNVANAGRWLLATDRIDTLLTFFANLPFVDPLALPVSAPDELGAIAAEAMARSEQSSHPGYLEACWWSALRAYLNGHLDEYRAIAEITGSAPNADASGAAIYTGGVLSIFDGDADGAEKAFGLASEQARRDGHQAQLAWMLGQRAQFERIRDSEAARRTAEEALAIARATGSPVVSLQPLVAFTSAATDLSSPQVLAAAEEILRVDLTQRRFHSNIVRSNVAGVRMTSGQIVDGLIGWREVLGSLYDAGERSTLFIMLGELARLLVPIDPLAAIEFAAIAEAEPLAPYAAFAQTELASLAEKRVADSSAARSRAAGLSYDDALAFVFTTVDRLITERTTADSAVA